jgi:hypothetical protein
MFLYNHLLNENLSRFYCCGALCAFRGEQRGHTVGFMKPVSQGPPDANDGTAGKWKGDPDVKLLKEYFSLPHEPKVSRRKAHTVKTS